ncbi:MAG TPA: hypothetical protein VJX67_25915 [Blastocatellia bacterium]|nr:hypothetical protein [Blastocatellia bacterium]
MSADFAGVGRQAPIGFQDCYGANQSVCSSRLFPIYAMAQIPDDASTRPRSNLKTGFVTAMRRRSVQIVAALLLVFAVMVRIQFAGPAILDNDGYYHIRWSKNLRQSLPHLPAFNYLPLTVLDKRDFVDHHFLFHVLLMPFTFGDLRLGAKRAAVVFSTLAIVSVFGLLVAFKVPYRWFWLVPLVGGSEPFLYRMSMTRAPSLAVTLLALGIYLIFKRKLVWLGLLAFVFVWSYSLFPLLFAFAAIYSVTIYLCYRRVEWGAVLASGLGIAAGLVVNPYFPKDLILFKEHLMMKVVPNYPVGVGVEWYPYDTWVVLTGSLVTFALYFAALLVFDFKNREADPKPLFFLIASAMLLVASFESRRFMEYWAPFAVLFSAFTIGPRIRRPGGRWFERPRDRIIAAVTAAVAADALLIGIAFNLNRASKDVVDEPSPYLYRDGGAWLMKNTAPGSLVFNVDWDGFGKLVYYDSQNRYVSGLDPTYLYAKDKELGKQYDDITDGKEDHPGDIIRDQFGARYCIAEKGDTDFLSSASDSGDFATVYEDKFVTILRVLDKKERAKTPDGDDGDDDASDGK